MEDPPIIKSERKKKITFTQSLLLLLWCHVLNALQFGYKRHTYANKSFHLSCVRKSALKSHAKAKKFLMCQTSPNGKKNGLNCEFLILSMFFTAKLNPSIFECVHFYVTSRSLYDWPSQFCIEPCPCTLLISQYQLTKRTILPSIYWIFPVFSTTYNLPSRREDVFKFSPFKADLFTSKIIVHFKLQSIKGKIHFSSQIATLNKKGRFAKLIENNFNTLCTLKDIFLKEKGTLYMTFLPGC